eukprot:GHVS01077749.1.p1 GENE.GHVS01077749.1~~GHVS01077749.1.p1  ORF type:complete len:230 (+),score=42.56 GHVS01077749.1:260-949(+)
MAVHTHTQYNVCGYTQCMYTQCMYTQCMYTQCMYTQCTHSVSQRMSVESSQPLAAELQSLEAELKDWFISRRVKLERAVSIKKALDESNFSGLSINNDSSDDAQRVMWQEIVNGKPDLDDKLGLDAREMKADMYMKMFKSATTRDHLCRVPGVAYLRCLSENFNIEQARRAPSCLSSFSSFEACRSSTLSQQAQAMQSSMERQELDDMRAKSMFERRNVLLDFRTGPPA